MTVLLWGTLRDGPTAAVHAELERLRVPQVLLDQSAVLATEIELCVGEKVEGSVRWEGRALDLADVTAVYARPHDARRLRSVEHAGTGSPEWRHALAVNELLWAWAETTDALVVSPPSATASNDCKPYQAERARRRGFLIPDTLVTTDPEAARAFWGRHGAVIYKSVSGVRSKVARLGPGHADRLDDVASCPTQFQHCIAGTDHRVHVVGPHVFACEVLCAADDYRYPGEHPPEIRAVEVPSEVADRCLGLADDLRLPVSGIDLRRTPDGAWYCFEVNPTPAFTYYEEASGLPIARALARFLADGR